MNLTSRRPEPVMETQGLPPKLHNLLTHKDSDLDPVIQAALKNAEVLKSLLDGLLVKEDAYRYNCFKALLQIAETQPAILYPHWEFITGLLDSDNAYHRSTAVNLLAHLTPADTANKFEALFERYFGLLDDPSIVVARYVARAAGVIAAAKPALREGIIARLLSLDETTHRPQDRKDLMKADVLLSLETIFDDTQDQARLLAFAEGLLDCESPKTRKAAKEFLKKFGN
jgi:hypothetical protein